MRFEDELTEILENFKEGLINYSEAIVYIEKLIVKKLGMGMYIANLVSEYDKNKKAEGE